MISELVPADVLLQRAGRLQRHKRDRQLQVKEKTVLWLIKPPTNADGSLIVKDNSPDLGKISAVYDKHILLRSWLRLRNETEIKIPEDIENLIEDVYDGERVFDELTEDELQIWRETLKKFRNNRELDKNEAQIRYVSSPHYPDNLGDFIKTPKEGAPELHPALQVQTRLLEPTANVVCLWEKEARFSRTKLTRKELRSTKSRLAKRRKRFCLIRPPLLQNPRFLIFWVKTCQKAGKNLCVIAL